MQNGLFSIHPDWVITAGIRLNALYRFYPEKDYILFTPEVSERLFENIQRFKVVSPQNRVAKKLKSLWRSLFLVPHLKRYEVDLFHGLSNELPKGIHKSGIPSVVTIHDLVFMRYPEFYQPLDRKIYFKKVKYACHAADKIIAISRQTRSDIETFFHVPPERVEMIYQPVASVFFEKQNISALAAEYQLPEKYILNVGTLEPRKNQLALLQAIHSVKQTVPLIFVGKPTVAYEAEMNRFIVENGMEDQVKFLRNVPESDLAGLYQAATLSVYISVFEGFGLPVIESMACGCPVLTSSVSVLPETAGDAGMLCDPSKIDDIAEKVTLLLENETLRKDLAKKGSERAGHFHPKAYAKKMIDLYNEILLNRYA
jgi:glycosyltransferase involved in cell wall biosynthesis